MKIWILSVTLVDGSTKIYPCSSNEVAHNVLMENDCDWGNYVIEETEVIGSPGTDDDSEDCEHEPDWQTASIEYDGDDIYVDVNCVHCGRSGCAGTSSTFEVDW